MMMMLIQLQMMNDDDVETVTDDE